MQSEAILSSPARCNICGGAGFETYRGRPGERCIACGAKARHRIALDVYERHLFPLAGAGARVLHFAPEAALHPLIEARFGAGYVTADAEPARYAHAMALRLRIPHDLEIFPSGYFTAILHNHVLEHVPGHYGDHLVALLRLLRPGGLMIFSVPGPYMDRDTQEGGERLASDAERLELFLQEDHLKRFGRDFVGRLASLDGARLIGDGMTDARRAELGVRPAKSPFFILART